MSREKKLRHKREKQEKRGEKEIEREREKRRNVKATSRLLMREVDGIQFWLEVINVSLRVNQRGRGMPSRRLRRNGILHEPRRISGRHLPSREKHWKARKRRKVGVNPEKRSWTKQVNVRRGVHEALTTFRRVLVPSHPRYLIFVHLDSRYSWQAVFKSSWNSVRTKAYRTDYRALCAAREWRPMENEEAQESRNLKK